MAVSLPLEAEDGGQMLILLKGDLSQSLTLNALGLALAAILAVLILGGLALVDRQ